MLPSESMISNSANYNKVRLKLYGMGFESVRREKKRHKNRFSIIVNGVNVEVKIARANRQGKWKVNIHRHGLVDETGVDAYLIILRDVPGNGLMPLYLVFSAPVSTQTFEFSFSSLMRQYKQNIDAWDTLREIAKTAVPA